jgi:PRTRC genetic system protein B
MEIQEKLYKPVQFITVHRSGDSYYLESGNINDDLSFGASHPLMKQTIIDIMDTMSVDVTDRLQFKGMIPKNVVTVRNTAGNTLVAWISKPQSVKMSFTKTVGLRDMTAPVPAMLWLAKNDHLSVFALKSNTINNKTKLYVAPFPNVSGSGSVCWGSGKWPKDVQYYEDFIEKVEYGFWNSKFSHNMEGVVSKSKSDLYRLWDALNGAPFFPTQQLLESPESNKIKEKLGI